MRGLLFVAVLSLCSSAWAVPTLTNLTENQAQTAIREFNAGFVHSTITGGSFPDVLGFQVAALGGMTKVPGIDGLVTEEFAYLPTGGLMATLQIPFGLGGELIWLPRISASGVNAENVSLAGTFDLASRLGLDSVLGWRVRAAYGTAKASYQQVVSSIPLDVAYKNSTVQVDTTVSLGALPILEPYLTLGYASTSGDLSVTGNGTIFGFTADKSYSAKSSGLLVAAGAEITLAFLKFGAEYSRHYETDRYLAKLGFGF